IWAIVLSLGFFGVKGGVFTILKGGSSIVWGPSGSFIEGNNELALALLMIIPLANYLRVISTKKWIKTGFLCAMVLIGVSAIGSQSRGAFLAAGAMVFYFWTKSDKKIISGTALLAIAGAIYAFMPQSWHDRMNTIKTYEEDGSAMGRINAWWTEFNIANDRFFGAGFNHYSAETFALYAPNPTDVHAAHSIYFQVLGGQGWIGFALFMAFCVLSLRLSKKITKKTKEIDSLKWADLLSRMVYVSLIVYAVGGAFLSLAYFDLPYHLMAILILTNLIVDRELTKPTESKIAFAKSDRKKDIPEPESLGKGLTNKVTYSKY
ncbi:MAG: putative O-glycosylation ligase, exosortase A system-associated, partial [Opitutaceae bacterium]|nr:putative O-glycosylation ligase, exosortase A system-associated [Opitutaceae bacterium]